MARRRFRPPAHEFKIPRPFRCVDDVETVSANDALEFMAGDKAGYPARDRLSISASHLAAAP